MKHTDTTDTPPGEATAPEPFDTQVTTTRRQVRMRGMIVSGRAEFLITRSEAEKLKAAGDVTIEEKPAPATPN